MIRLENINKHYGSLHVLKNINLEIGKGEIVAIVGASGAGKTTLLQIAGTLDKADSGSIIYDDIDVNRLNDRRLSAFRNSHIGFVFQMHHLLPEFTAIENVMMPALIGGKSKHDAKEKAKELLQVLGLSDRENHKPQQMSGGECQRVAIARALINSPSVIFADEPTGSLDTRNREEIQAVFRQLRDLYHTTFVIVTHDPSLAAVADRVVNMRDGEIISINQSKNVC
jgi:lipoprotein-releasing system ATP-binding protein